MNAVRNVLHQPPLIKKKPGDYQEACYTPTLTKRGGRSIKVSHFLPSGNLVADLIAEGKARYCCEIISPLTFYRELFALEPSEGTVQTLKINPEEVSVKESILHPIIVSTHQAEIEVCEEHGLHKLFAGKIIEILPGTILADGGYYDVVSEDGKLFSKCEDPNLASGTYSLTLCHEPAFHFSISLAPDLHKNFDNTAPDTKRIFLTGIFASALERLEKACRDEDGNINEEFFVDHPRAKTLLEKLGEQEETYEQILTAIKEGEASILASHYRPINMILDDEH